MIAAATIGERMGIITKEMSGMFILVAVITSVITPIVFKKLFPFGWRTYEENKIAIIGANQFTLPVYPRVKNRGLYEPIIYHKKQEKIELQSNAILFNIVEIADFSIETLSMKLISKKRKWSSFQQVKKKSMRTLGISFKEHRELNESFAGLKAQN